MELNIIKEQLNNYKYKTILPKAISLCLGQITYFDETNNEKRFGFNHIDYNEEKHEYTFISYTINGNELTNNIKEKLTIDETKLISYLEIPLIIGT